MMATSDLDAAAMPRLEERQVWAPAWVYPLMNTQSQRNSQWKDTSVRPLLLAELKLPQISIASDAAGVRIGGAFMRVLELGSISISKSWLVTEKILQTTRGARWNPALRAWIRVRTWNRHCWFRRTRTYGTRFCRSL